jgi:hypothetical protein
MKKTQRSKAAKHGNELKAEYDFDYAKARPNRFAGRPGKDCTVVVLDRDVSKVFSTSEAVNGALWAFIAAIPRAV